MAWFAKRPRAPHFTRQRRVAMEHLRACPSERAPRSASLDYQKALLKDVEKLAADRGASGAEES